MGLVAYAQSSSGSEGSSEPRTEAAAVVLQVAPCGTAVKVALKCAALSATDTEDDADSAAAAAELADAEDCDIIFAVTIAALKPPKVMPAARQMAERRGAATAARSPPGGTGAAAMKTGSTENVTPVRPLGSQHTAASEQPVAQPPRNDVAGWQAAKGGPGFARAVLAQGPVKRLCSWRELQDMQDTVNSMRTAANKHRQ